MQAHNGISRGPYNTSRSEWPAHSWTLCISIAMHVAMVETPRSVDRGNQNTEKTKNKKKQGETVAETQTILM